MESPSVLLLGFTVPDAVAKHLFTLDLLPAAQTHKFAWSLSRALSSGFGKVVLASACPIQSYPLGRKLLFRGRPFRAQGTDGVLLGFVNLLLLKHLTRFIACLMSVPRLVRRHRVMWIFVHGVHTPFLVFALLMRLTGRRVAVVLTDPPGVLLPTDSFVAGALKRLDYWLIARALRHSDLVVALAPMLVQQFAPSTPALVFPGIVDASMMAIAPTRPRPGDDPFTILYAGSLTRAYGVDRLLEAVAGIDGVPVRLRLFGRGDLESEVRAMSSDPRFEYAGFVGPDRLMDEFARAHVLINPRPTTGDVAVMSFPSKLIEYLAAGRPVMTTRLASIPAAYLPHFFVIDDESVEGIRDSILKMTRMSADDRERRAAEGQAFVRANASEPAIGKAIARLVADAYPPHPPTR